MKTKSDMDLPGFEPAVLGDKTLSGIMPTNAVNYKKLSEELNAKYHQILHSLKIDWFRVGR